MFLVDSHCHLDGLNYKSVHQNVTEVLAKAAMRDVKFVLSVATTLQGYQAMVDLIGIRPNVAYSCGMHPLNHGENFDVAELRRLAADPHVLAIGETGLDYFYHPETKSCQQELFREHIRVGRDLNKPVIVHSRESSNDAVAILYEEQAGVCGGVLHCFTEGHAIAKKLLDIGLYISFSGIATFRNAAQIRETARYVPLDRMLVETDSPYLAPVPHRGKENQPAYTRDVAEYMAAVKGVSIEELAKMTTENFSRLFHVSMDHLTN